MRKCHCAEDGRKPVHFASPLKRQDWCQRCEGVIPPPELRHYPCSRCGAGLDFQDVYVVGFHRPMERMQWEHLCAECEVELRAWMGQIPT